MGRLLLRLLVLSCLALVVPDVPAEETGDLVSPEMTGEEPAAGRRVRQTAAEYEGSEVYHALYLPTNWVAGGSYPVIVEYTGNRYAACGSSGEVKDANLGFGLSGGRDYIWVSMPYIEKGGKKNALTWWGDREATVEYCKTNLPRICERFGGDPERVLICGFSRGAIATSYIGLADDEIAGFWRAFLTHDHFDGDTPWDYAESDRKSALARLARLRGRPVLVGGGANDFLRRHPGLAAFTFLRPPVAEIFDIPEGKVIHPHTDLWMHRESEYRDRARAWLSEVMGGDAAAGWVDLFDGKTLDGWRGYQREGVPASWEVKDGSVFCNGKDDAHLVTEKEYGDFELTGEWKISKGGNSGILLRVVEVTPWPATSGLELQVIDHSDGWKEVHGSGLGLGQGAGALYGLYPAKEEAIKRAGEWNTVRIRMEGTEIEVWQNGVVLVEADMASEDWKARLGRSKFAGSEHFNKAERGHIALQNYRGAGVWFRNLRIREIGGG